QNYIDFRSAPTTAFAEAYDDSFSTSESEPQMLSYDDPFFDGTAESAYSYIDLESDSSTSDLAMNYGYYDPFSFESLQNFAAPDTLYNTDTMKRFHPMKKFKFVQGSLSDFPMDLPFSYFM
ncbi:hypothetical protein TNCT_359841, partial [Trichonephila clavata]